MREFCMKNAQQDWYQLDNAAKIFPGQNSRTWSNVFRVGVELHEKVQPDKLKTALNQVLPRFPTFDVKMKNGFFWHYFEKNPQQAEVQPDIKNICYRINFKENRGFLFRVYSAFMLCFCCSLALLFIATLLYFCTHALKPSKPCCVRGSGLFRSEGGGGRCDPPPLFFDVLYLYMLSMNSVDSVNVDS